METKPYPCSGKRRMGKLSRMDRKETETQQRASSPRPSDSLAPTRSARSGPLPLANSFRGFPSRSSPLRMGRGTDGAEIPNPKIQAPNHKTEEQCNAVARKMDRMAYSPQPLRQKGRYQGDDSSAHAGWLSRNAGFIRQRHDPPGPLPDKSGVPVVWRSVRSLPAEWRRWCQDALKRQPYPRGD